MRVSTQPRERVEVTGVVQGVGFRPFVYRLATELGVTGSVGNDGSGVFIDATAPAPVLDDFARRLATDAPPLAIVDGVTRHRLHDADGIAGTETGSPGGFRIIESAVGAGPRTLIPPDTAVCADCLAELSDPTNRRFGHPFITCTNCGPRFSIITDLPYDRPNTTMAPFALCDACAAEYADPADRRYHAQPIGCHDCGPTLTWRWSEGGCRGGAAGIAAAAACLRNGGIVAVKGLGGFHLAVDATDDEAVACLRRRKHRPDKPLAVMVTDLAMARTLVELNPIEEQALMSPARPVVLAPRRPDATVAPSVAPGNPLLGVMVAYTPVHHLLLAGVRRPLVMTSANLSGEPMVYRDADIEHQIGPVADGLLTNDRPIVAPCDDSVIRVIDGAPVPIRRGRGYAPIPIDMDGTGRHVLATGGELKNTFCLSDGAHAWVSPHIGDMGTLAALDAFERAVAGFTRMYRVTPEVVAADAHPGYVTTRWAHRHHGDRILEVHHHHAHVAAVMAEHRLDPHTPVLGIAFDGTGYGDDGTIWGGEVMRVTATGYDRLAHLVPVPLPGGDAAIAQPARSALAHLHIAGIDWSDDLAPVSAIDETERHLLARQLDTGFGCVPTTSMGRLFDAVASLLGLRHHITYEAQGAIELEHLAATFDLAGDEDRPSRYRFAIGSTPQGDLIDQRPVIGAIVDDRRAGHDVASIAARFHLAVVDAVTGIVARHRRPDETVVLSGGVFQNAFLAEHTTGALRAESIEVLTHRLVPPNDGGLALGQAFVATHTPIDPRRER